MLNLVVVFVGGAVGSLCRYWFSTLVSQRFGNSFPYDTLFVNLVGSFMIGLIAGYVMRFAGTTWGQLAQEFFAVGVCGGLTTFSSFSLQTFDLISNKRWVAALINIVVSTVACLAFVALGWMITCR